MNPYLRAKNWARFQHYRGRRPPWIKLHRELLDNFEFSCLPVASKALAPCLWLLASEYDEGAIPADANAIAFRLHMTPREFLDALKPLLDGGFFSVDEDASNALATRKQDAIPESESETESEKESDGDFFDDWYSAYPRKVGRGQAVRAYRAACKKAKPDVLLAACKRFAEQCGGKDPTFIPHPATWLNGERWLDQQSAGPVKPEVGQPASEPWEKRMQGFKETGFWVGTWGPRPGEPHCHAPRELIEKYLQ